MTDPERAEFAARCEAHRAMLRVHCYRMTGSVDDAEDLVQEFLAALQHLPRQRAILLLCDVLR